MDGSPWTKGRRYGHQLPCWFLVNALILAFAVSVAMQSSAGATETVTIKACPGTYGVNNYDPSQCTWYALSMRPDLPYFAGTVSDGSTAGTAKNWGDSATECGFEVNGKPQVGDIIVFSTGVASVYQTDAIHGHVAYVDAVNSDGSIVISEKNFGNTQAERSRIHTGTLKAPLDPHLQFIHKKPTTVPPIPALKGPTAGATFASANQVNLTWSGSGTGYQVELSPLGAGQNRVLSDWIKEPHWQSAALTQSGQYTWRVRARNDVGIGAWSAPRSFSISAPSASATPADGWIWRSESFYVVAPIDWKFTLTNVDRDAKVLVDGNIVVDTRTECGSVGSVSLSWGSHTYLIGHPQGTSAPKLSYGPTLVAVACAAGPITSATSTAVPTPTPPATPTPSPTATPTPVPTPQPSGTWIEPADSTEVRGATVHFAAHAYPVHAGDPSIDHVNFTVWWSTMGPKSGPWKTVCTATRPASGDLFQCDADLSTLDPEPDWNTAELLVSFDVYDVHKNHTLAPDGEHVLRWGPTAADDYEIRKYYPLAQFLPYNSDDFDVEYYTDKLTLPVTIKTPDVARAKQEVRDWIQSHGVDPSTHQLIWTTPAATQPSDPIAFVGTGCSPSPLPSALQSNRFSGASETCYNFIFSGFGGAWPLIALDVIQPDGIYTQGDPAGVITGNGETGYVPDQFGFILFFSSATSYPNGSWKIHVEDRAGHDVDAAFTYPAN